jgi:hypothetical protein
MYNTRTCDSWQDDLRSVHEIYMGDEFISGGSIRRAPSLLAHAGMGVFANERLRKHAIVGEYTGRIVPDADCNPEWSMKTSRGPDYMIDASTSRRTCMVRFINSALPLAANCIVREMYADGRVFIVTKRSIPMDAELLYYYGPDYPYPDYPNHW